MRAFAWFCFALVLNTTFLPAMADPGGSPPPSGKISMDLNSSSKSLSASALGITAPVAIRVGAARTAITPNSMLTPAEYVAAMQVLQTGRQSLILSSGGQAIAGRFNMSGISGPDVSNLVVPHGVTML